MSNFGLLQRGNRWFFQIRIPSAVQAAYGGRKFIKRALHTDNRKVALTRASLVEAQCRTEFENRLRGIDGVNLDLLWHPIQPIDYGARWEAINGRSLTELFTIEPQFMEQLFSRYLRDTVEQQEALRTDFHDGKVWERVRPSETVKTLWQVLAEGIKTEGYGVLRRSLDNILAYYGYRLVGQPDGLSIILGRLERVIKQLTALLTGLFAGEALDIERDLPRDAMLPHGAEGPKAAVTADNIMEEWKAGKTSRTPKSVDEYSSILRRFEAFLQAERKIRHASLASDDDAIAYADYLLKQGLTNKTAAKHIGALTTLFKVATSKKKLVKNIFAEVEVARDENQEKTRDIFSLEQLQQIFTSRTYTKGLCPGGYLGPSAFWVPLIALYAGMRVEEICQMRVADVRKLRHDEGEGWCIGINRDDGKKVKTRWAVRYVPLHRKLEELGFLTFIDQCRARKQRLIFPELKADKYARASTMFSKLWNAEMRSRLDPLLGSKNVSFHSFRHTFKHYCRLKRIAEDIHDALTGHAPPPYKRVPRGYGGADYPKEPLFEAMERFAIAGLDLSHLDWSAWSPREIEFVGKSRRRKPARKESVPAQKGEAPTAT